MAEKTAATSPPPHFTRPSAPSPSYSRQRLLTTILLVNNIHCASCVTYAKEVVSHLPHIAQVDISILKHEVRISHSTKLLASELVDALTDAAFEVFHATTQNEFGIPIDDIDIDTSSWNTGSWLRPSSRLSVSTMDTRTRERNRRHIANCDACQREQEKYAIPDKDTQQEKTQTPKILMSQGSILSIESSSLSSGKHPSPVPHEPVKSNGEDEYTAQISISGMTCASCSNTITEHIQELDFVKSIVVNLVTHSAALTFRGPRENIDKITERIEDLGYDASAEEVVVLNSRPRDLYVANLSISGMTCGSCVGSITHDIKGLSFVTDAVVDLLSHSGRIEFEGEGNLKQILDAIDDLGYDATVIDCKPIDRTEGAESGPKARTIGIKVDGMFCHHCPGTVMEALGNLEAGKIQVEEQITTQKPIVTITYTPDPPKMTIRNILSAIDASNNAFKASVYHPPSIEDRSRAMQKQEQRRLLLRLLFTFIVAIPTFLIGIVWMAVVPKSNSVRQYLEEPMWAGSASRLEWALLIMTTPVMVYGTDVFHARALKEIRALWRPGSRVPFLRRFYRFGSMNMLISAGTSVAYFASVAVLIINAKSDKHEAGHTSSYFDTVVFLTLFILAGRALEGYSKAKTGDAVSMLGKLRPSEALLVVESPSAEQEGPKSSIQRVPVDLLEINDIVSVPHGASPPADGVVTGTDTYKFDESSLTGESMPVRKVAGDKVYSGSVNVGQPVSIRITDLGSTSMLDQIVAVVREGQAKRAPVERVADVMTGYFVPIITLIAILTFVIWVGLGESGALPPEYLDSSQGGWTFWSLQFAIAVFVVACPCGLALAAPTALFVGGGLAAKRGILVRGGGEAFQEASRLDAIVFDKTGTLTEGGTLKVSDHEVLIDNGELEQVAWAAAKALEESSTHPIARAIVDFCSDRSSVSVTSSSINEIGGQGMKGTFTVPAKEAEDTPVEYEAAIGNQRLLSSLMAADSDTYYLDNLLSKYQSAGRSTAILSIRRVSGPGKFVPAIVFATADPIRAEAVDVIRQLRANNIDIYMCTGDNTVTAHAVASTIGIPSTNVMSNVLPTQKAEYIRKIKNNELSTHTGKSPNKKTIVGFVGDGTNDSPALAAADVSIAMASGSDVAVSSAGFILLNSDLRTILELCTLSRRVFRRVKWNFLWAAVYNVCLIPVAAGVFYPIVSGHKTDSHGRIVNTHWRLDPVWAALAMALSSLSVVMSSLALRLEWRSIKGWAIKILMRRGDERI
ncbi:heavy metal translocating P-type ATPase [Coccidioides posadasii str. Silveira]|uniref:Heavy metal translocating P-type ATPase n=1 Tax=Coccidioides posadasii (strain RMSCC 757 / Silveira) TaxID=443226 RepID=E9CXJ0_COCPS|nr:heavy metal translocating P-type ATPase [Coccidioides posadasii str. Silveira]